MDKLFDTMTVFVDKLMTFVEGFMGRVFQAIGTIGDMADEAGAKD